MMIGNRMLLVQISPQVMAKDVIEEAEPHIREIVRICRVLEAGGRELNDFNDLVARTIQNCTVELNGGTDSPGPISIHIKCLRRSSRQTCQKKRPYKTMQGANKKAGRLPQKPNLTTDESATDEPATDEPATDEPATDESATDISATDAPASGKLASSEPATEEPATEKPATEPPPLESTDETAIIEPNTMESQENPRNYTSEQGNSEAMASFAVVTTTKGGETAVGRAVEGDLPTITYTDGVTILEEYFPKPAVSSPLLHLVPAQAAEALTTPPSAGPSAIASEATGILDPDQGTGSCEMSKSTSNTGSAESTSGRH